MDIHKLEALLVQGTDHALLRYSLGSACLKEGRAEDAIQHLSRAVAFDPQYSAAWKLYGKALAERGRREEARQAYRSGIEAAEARGDLQAAKEMRVFLRRLEKAKE
jgi:Flp pilus assembly protein TadD